MRERGGVGKGGVIFCKGGGGGRGGWLLGIGGCRGGWTGVR